MTTSTAAQAYTEADEQISALIARLQTARQAHAQRFAAQPNHWGYAGDLANLREQLQRAVEAVGA